MQRIVQDWRDIRRGVKMSFDFNRLVFAFLGIIASVVWMALILTSCDSLGLFTVKASGLMNNFLFSLHPDFSSLLTGFSDLLMDAGLGEYAALTVLALGLLAIWSLAGGSITRSAALEFAVGEKLTFKNTIAFAVEKFWSYFWSPIIPVLGMLFFSVCNIIGGVIGQTKYVGEIAAALGFPLAIISGVLIVFIGIVGLIGFFLMFPTISAEGSDCFDAMSRSYSYVLARPKHFVSLFLCIIFCGVFFTFFLNGISCLIMQTSFTTVGFGMGQKFDSIRALVSGNADPAIQVRGGMASPVTWSLKFFTFMLIIYLTLVKAVVGSFVVAFAGTASTIAYFILRKDVDGTEIGDVYYEESAEGINHRALIDENTGEETASEQGHSQNEFSGESDTPSPVEPSRNEQKNF